MCLIAEMTCDFAFTRKHTVSRPIRFYVMSSLVLHVYALLPITPSIITTGNS